MCQGILRFGKLLLDSKAVLISRYIVLLCHLIWTLFTSLRVVQIRVTNLRPLKEVSFFLRCQKYLVQCDKVAVKIASLDSQNFNKNCESIWLMLWKDWAIVVEWFNFLPYQNNYPKIWFFSCRFLELLSFLPLKKNHVHFLVWKEGNQLILPWTFCSFQGLNLQFFVASEFMYLFTF